MANIPPIDDNYIDDIIKSTGPYNVAITTTQGVKLRELVKKLRDYFEQQIQQGFSEAKFANNAERDAYNVASLPFQAFVTDDGDGKWALYRATSTGVRASYIKISDPDLLNVAMSSGAVTTDIPLGLTANNTIYDKRNGLPVSNYSNYIGYDTGVTGDTGSDYTNYIGYRAGGGSQGNIFANFIGKEAGSSNSGSYYSNFIGAGAGSQANNAVASNFLGVGAGRGATNAESSNFFGPDAGAMATDAKYSNFFGDQAGKEARGSSGSSFLGKAAGRSAADAANSNFFGYQAGEGANNAAFSNFFGYRAGEGAQGSTNSNFLGYKAGFQAFNSSYSNLFGYQVGGRGIGANNIIIGKNITLPDGTANAINLGGILFASGTYADDNTVSRVPVDGGKIGIGILTPTEALDVNGNIKIRNLSGIGDRAVLAAPDGTLKIGGNITIPTFRQVTSSSYEAIDNSSDGFYLGTMQPGHPFVHFSCGGINPDNNVVIPCSIQAAVMGKGGGSTLALQPYVADYPGAGVAIGLGTANATEALDVNGNIKIRNLSGTGDRLVVTDETGKLKEGYRVSNIVQQSDMTLDNVLSSGNGSHQTIILGDFNNVNFGTALTIGVRNDQSDQPAIISAQRGVDPYPVPIYVLSSQFHLRGGDLVVAALSGKGDRPVFADPDGKFKIGESTALPSNVTKATLGLDKVDNISDVDKPVSIAVQTALNAKVNGDDVPIALSNATLYDKRTTLNQIPLNSILFGYHAGIYANNASNSNFFGNQAGANANEASNSNFFGYMAGSEAINAFNSNFFGSGAGTNAVNASNSNFFGSGAGNDSPKASYSNLFGYNVGINGIGTNNIIIGKNITLLKDTINAINLGGILFASGTYAGDTISSAPVDGGKIGIGIFTPTEALDVNGNIQANGLKLKNATSGNALSISTDLLTASRTQKPQDKDGVIALTSDLNQVNAVTKTSDYTISANDDYIIFETTPADVTVTLPPAASVPGKMFGIFNGSGKILTINTTGAANEIRNPGSIGTPSGRTLVGSNTIKYLSNGTYYYEVR